MFFQNKYVYVEVSVLVNKRDKRNLLLYLESPVNFTIQYNDRSLAKPIIKFNPESTKSTYAEVVEVKKISTNEFSTDEEDPDSPNYVDEPGPLEAGKKRLRKNKCSRF